MSTKNVIFVGLDVDSKNYHATLMSREQGEISSFRCKADTPELIKRLRTFLKKGFELKVCYEASFVGFSLCRDLSKANIRCDVIAPSNIPRAPGHMVKTDRIDAKKLAEFYMNGLLTPVNVPDEETEADRDILRTRHFLQNQNTKVKYKIIFFCRKIGLNYKECTDSKRYFTGEHLKWLEQKAAALENPSQRTCLVLLLKQLRQNMDMIADFDAELEKMASKERYKKQVAALSCFRGISRVFSLQIITEIGDIRRFSHPRQLVSFVGMDIIEYSSGGRANRYSITKTGNCYLRTALVEACQRIDKTPKETKHLRARREEVGSTRDQIAMADRCMRRLYKKSLRLTKRGKHVNKVKVACAREMIGFVWEAMKAAA